MDGFMWDFSSTSWYRRLAALVSVICIADFSPISAATLETQTRAANILNHVADANEVGLVEDFDNLNKMICSSNDPLVEGRAFMQNFINEVNAQYGLSLAISDACNLVRDNIHTLQFPEETQSIVLRAIELLESNSLPAQDQNQTCKQSVESNGFMIKWPFYLHGNIQKHKHKHKHVTSLLCYIDPIFPSDDLPANCYIGGCELLAGALLCILPFPGAAYCGTVLMGDGARRVIDGVQQLGDERRANPNYISPVGVIA